MWSGRRPTSPRSCAAREVRRVENPRFHKIETLLPNAHVHLLRVTEPGQLDDEVRRWVKEAYAIGCQEHLRPRRAR